MTKVWIVEDEEIKRVTLVSYLGQKGYDGEGFADAEEALNEMAQTTPQIIITDLRLPGMDGLELLRRVKEKRPFLPVIIMTAYGTVDTAVAAMKLGAYDYLVKPVELRNLLSVIRRLEQLQSFPTRPSPGQTPFPSLIGKSEAMQAVYDLIRKVAPTNSTVLIQGESGTGKEKAAEAIHSASARHNKRLVKVSCAILTDTLLESELFGHEQGAFTGAIKTKPGRFELADGGTIFLDDIDDVPLSTQVKLLRVLQEKQIERVGGIRTIEVDVRILAATKTDLLTRVKEGKFREDLYFRVNVLPITLPPLRERVEDIPLLVNHLLDKFCQRDNKPRPEILPEVMDSFLSYPWPGNVRELENALERMVALIGPDVPRNQLIPSKLTPDHWSVAFSFYERVKQGEASFQQVIEEIERDLISRSMKEAGGNKAKGARILKMKRSTLCDKLKKFHLEIA